jgi:hypothetical protein
VFSEAAYLADDVVGLVVAHPSRILASPLAKMLMDAGAMKPFQAEIEQLNIDPATVDRMTLVVSQDLVNKSAQSAGLAAPSEEAGPGELKNNLKQIALGFHNMHDAYGAFPRANGDPSGAKTGLSWRVWLLPMLDEGPLFNEFHHDEPWDSEHNKSLIAKMPKIYRTPGVDDPTKTALQVFTGEGTLFDDDKKGHKISDVTDGSSNTLMAILAGADKAEVWTKPGGLPFDGKDPAKALGTPGDGAFLVAMTDGSVTQIPPETPAAEWAKLIQRNDGQIVNVPRPEGGPGSPGTPPTPTMIVSFNAAPAMDGILAKFPKSEDHEGQAIRSNEKASLWTADAKTVVIGPADGLKKMISARKANVVGKPKVLTDLPLGADLVLVADLESQGALLETAAVINPMLGQLAQVQRIALEASITGKPGDNLLKVTASIKDEMGAETLTKMLDGFLAMGKQQVEAMPLRATTDLEKETSEFGKRVVRSASVKQNGKQVVFHVPVPADFDRLPELLKPAVTAGRDAAQRATERNRGKMIALAFHNYESTYRSFPGASKGHKGKGALSWRVHLLPYLDAANLYEQFHLDEPWDSEHNKALIAQMPEVYQSASVKEPGKTTMHVYTSKTAPFGENRMPKISDFTDGTSTTFLLVQAGPDKAEPWTKPGGLDFDAKNPAASLGKVASPFLGVFADGSVKNIAVTIDATTLLHLIEHADGNPVDGY